MKFRDKPFAMREISPEFKNWLLALLIATTMCAVIAPFGTDQLAISGRVLFWSFSNISAALIMYCVILLAEKTQLKNYWPQAFFCAFVFASIFTPLLRELYRFADFSPTPRVMIIWINSVLISLAIFAIIWLAMREREQAYERPPLYRRLQKFPNAQIFALSAQDHYVEVITSQGSELLRIRMQDAIGEMKGEAGFQVHRSHWVALAAVDEISNANIILKNGRKIPLSRKRLNDFRAALKSVS